jgi:hypothetical protein
MSYPHPIRLRGPWQVEPLLAFESNVPLPAPCRMRMPGRLGDTPLHSFRGRVRFGRAFGYPGRLDEQERVWLTFAGVEGQGMATLNNHLLGDLTATGEFEVTRLLQRRNILTVDIDCTEPSAGLWGEVALEVRMTAFLRQVVFARAASQVSATGLVVGRAERPLELYLLAQNRCQAYQQVTAAESGQPFSMTAQLAEPGEDAFLPVRVELIQGATVWYVVEGTVNAQSVGSAGSS